MKKNTYLITLSLLLISCFLIFFIISNIKIKQYNKNENSNIENGTGLVVNKNENSNIESGTGLVVNKNEKNTIDHLYNELIVKNNLNSKWTKDIFNSFLIFYNNNYFLSGDYIIEENGIKNEKNPGIYYLNNSDEIVKILRSLNESKLDFDKNKDTDLEIYKYDLFYNDRNNYFFFGKVYYEENGICKLYTKELKEYKGMSLKNNNYFDIIYRYNNSFFPILSEEKYNKFLSTNIKINDRLYVMSGLQTIIKKFIESGFDEKYNKLFYLKFDEQLSPYYSNSEFDLLFLMDIYNNKITNSYCTDFSNKYFIGK